LTTILAITADHHGNSQVGLCPPTIKRDKQGTYYANKAQRWTWRKWLQYWEDIKNLKEKHSARVIATFLGDTIDQGGVRRGRHGYEMISHNETIIIRIGVKMLQPAVEVADDLVFLRGTSSHVGPSAAMEEKLAEDLGGRRLKNEEGEPFAHYALLLNIEGVTVDLGHRPVTFARRPWTRGPGCSRLAKIILDDYRDAGLTPPQVAARAHLHYWAHSGTTYPVEAWQCPPWQLTPAYAYEMGAGVAVEPVGGLILICDDGDYQMKHRLYSAPPEKAWAI
jgi:hypothetical protein